MKGHSTGDQKAKLIVQGTSVAENIFAARDAYTTDRWMRKLFTFANCSLCSAMIYWFLIRHLTQTPIIENKFIQNKIKYLLIKFHNSNVILLMCYISNL